VFQSRAAGGKAAAFASPAWSSPGSVRARAKGFVFLTLEDETGIANIIVRPDLFARDRLAIIEEPFLIVDGVLQNQEGVTSVRAEAVQGMRGVDVDFNAHDFY
jgi:error-prone DNA polymerase